MEKTLFMNLAEFLYTHVIRDECKCGKCCDKGDMPDLTGHTVDMVFFHVSAIGSPSKDEFLKLTREWPGEFAQVDPFDGKEHGYMELGGWIGDQGLAMMYMGLGVLLGVFRLLSPAMLTKDKDLQMQLAGNGYLIIRARKS